MISATRQPEKATKQQIWSFLERLTQQQDECPRSDRRAEPRFLVSVLVEVQPLSDTLEPDGPAFQARTRDISVSGIGLIHPAPIANKSVIVVMQTPDGERIELLTEVLRCRAAGDQYDIGGKFVTGG